MAEVHSDNSFGDRFLQASQEVYNRIVQGEVDDVEAELMTAHLNSSPGAGTS